MHRGRIEEGFLPEWNELQKWEKEVDQKLGILRGAMLLKIPMFTYWRLMLLVVIRVSVLIVIIGIIAW